MTKTFIPVAEPSITELEIEYVTDAVKSGWVSSLGEHLQKFEQRFAEFCGTKFCASVSNGTTGLHLALVAMDIGPGDEVIVPDLTFVATANVVRHAGATPVFADVSRDTLCLDPRHVEALITPRTKALIPVHLYGHPADMDALNAVARRHDLKVIEDAAEAIGAEYKGVRVGSLGDCAVFSLYGNKILTSGEGGMITTNSEPFFERCKRLRDHAMSETKRYWHTEVGFNYRMTNLQGALGRAQIERVQEILSKRQEVFDLYYSLLSDLPGVRMNRKMAWAKPACWMVCLESEHFSETNRTQFMARLKALGIDSRPYFYPVSDMPMYQLAATPVSHEISLRGINLPSSFNLTESQVRHISAVVRALHAELVSGGLKKAA